MAHIEQDQKWVHLHLQHRNLLVWRPYAGPDSHTPTLCTTWFCGNIPEEFVPIEKSVLCNTKGSKNGERSQNGTNSPQRMFCLLMVNQGKQRMEAASDCYLLVGEGCRKLGQLDYLSEKNVSV